MFQRRKKAFCKQKVMGKGGQKFVPHCVIIIFPLELATQTPTSEFQDLLRCQSCRSQMYKQGTTEATDAASIAFTMDAGAALPIPVFCSIVVDSKAQIKTLCRMAGRLILQADTHQLQISAKRYLLICYQTRIHNKMHLQTSRQGT